MRNVTDRIFIFTSWNSEKETNQLRYENLFNSLVSNKRSVARLTNAIEGLNEPSFLLVGDNNFEEIVSDICKTHKQESFLIVYPAQDSLTEVVYSNGTRKDLGKLTQVSKEDAEKSSSYTEAGGVYYVIK